MDQQAPGHPQDKHAVLREVFGFAHFRAGQEEPIDVLLAGRPVFCVMPTGAGKSLIYQLPALLLGGLTIVVSPLIALMEDQISALKLLGIAAGSINSSHTRAQNMAVWEEVRAGRTRLLYLAPERLMSAATLEALKRQNVSLIAIDEAHCISQWGPSFRPEYELLTGIGQHFPGVPVLALTASADATTRQDIERKLFDGTAHSVLAGFDRPNIALNVLPKTGWQRQLLKFVQTRQGQSGIVYCLSRKKTETAAQMLNGMGVRALAYHAGMDKAARRENQRLFDTEPGMVMAATIAFGMGIDKPDVRYVFHTDLPASMEAYYQEFGRAGRDGEPAEAVMLYGLQDIRMRRQFIEDDGGNDEAKRRAHKRLDALIAYCEASICRRQVLLDYFGETSQPCGNCDTCLHPPVLEQGLREGQMVLSAVVRTGQRFGQAYIIDILVGAQTARLKELGHDCLPTWGVGKEHPKPLWRTIIRQLVAAGFLHLDISGYGGLSLTAKGRALLKGEEEFRYRKPPGRRVGKHRTGPVAAATEEPPLSADQEAILEKLKAVRLSLARQRKVPAYVIFTDKTLRDMARQNPQNRAGFARIHGVGAAKLERFAEGFLAVLRQSESN